MKFFITTLFLFFFQNILHAQHCGFDSKAIVMLKPHAAENDSSIVSGLKITVLDKNYNPLVCYRGDTAIMYRNDTAQTYRYNNDRHPARFIPNHSTYISTGIFYFGFAADNYISVIGYEPWRKALLAKVEDTLASREGGKFATTIINIPNNLCFPLCENFSWKGIRAVDIVLAKE
jgi:hypothetical protein